MHLFCSSFNTVEEKVIPFTDLCWKRRKWFLLIYLLEPDIPALDFKEHTVWFGGKDLKQGWDKNPNLWDKTATTKNTEGHDY